MISLRPATSAASIGARRRPDSAASKRRDRLLAFFGFQRTGAVDQRAARLEQRDGLLQQPLLQRRQRGDVGLLTQPGHVGVTADGAGRGAGRIDQDAVKAFGQRPAHSAASAHHSLGLQRQPRQIVAQPRHARRRAVDRGDARAGLRQLRGLAAGRGAEIGDGLAGDVAEQPRRQRGGGVLHPPLALGEAGQHGHRALQQRAHGAGRQRFTVQPARPLRGVRFHGEVERRLDGRCASAISRAVVSP